MTIKITRNEAANCINFVGSTNPAYFNACLSAVVNAEDSNRIDIINDIRTENAPTTQYEFYAVEFTDFADADGNAFADAQAAADYVNLNANVANNTGRFLLSSTDVIDFSVDQTDTTVLLGNGDAYAVNSIRAAANDVGHIDILKHSSDIVIYGDLRLENATINGAQVTQTLATAVNELNALFAHSGGAGGVAPDITSAASMTLTTGDTLNYELTATNGVAYEWYNLPAGVTTVEGDIKHIIGGSELEAGDYIITAKAINYFGVDTQSITLTVEAPDFANTKSVKFNNLDYLSGNASLLDASLGRSNNGSGSGDAWTISMWVKPEGTQNNQTLFFYGGDDVSNEGNIWIRYYGGASLQTIRLQYGSDNNRLTFIPPDESFPRGQWTHLLIAYDGGTTGSSSGDLAAYYSRFSIYSNGVLQTTSNGHANYGFSGAIKDELLRVGREGNEYSYIRSGGKVDEVAVWGSDQSSNVSDIYNSGTPRDLSSLTSAPDHWWRMGDGDTYPTIQDNAGSAHFVMRNMTAADIVTDAP